MNTIWYSLIGQELHIHVKCSKEPRLSLVDKRLIYCSTDTLCAGSILRFSVLALQNKSNCDRFTIVVVKSMKIQ